MADGDDDEATYKSGASSSTDRITPDSCTKVKVDACPKGQGLSVMPSTTTDGVCSSCVLGTSYSKTRSTTCLSADPNFLSACKARWTDYACEAVKVASCGAGQGLTPATITSDGICTNCLAGYYSPPGSQPGGHSDADACLQCGADNKYSGPTSGLGTHGCSTCPPGSRTSGGSVMTRTTCSLCPAGHKCTGDYYGVFGVSAATNAHPCAYSILR